MRYPLQAIRRALPGVLYGVVLLLGGVAGAQSTAEAQPGLSRTLPDAIAQALEHQPTVAAARQRVQQAEFRLRGSLAFPSTLLDIGHGHTLTQPGASGNDQDVLLSQHLELFGQRRLRGDQSRWELTAAQALLSQAQADARSRVRTAFAQQRAAVGEVELARQAVTVAEAFRRLAEAQFQAGEVPIAGVLRSEIELENAGQALLAAETQLRIQQAALSAAMAAPLEAPVTLPVLSEVTLHTFDYAELQQFARRQPALRAADATLAARRSAVSVARSAFRPDVVIDAAHDQLQSWPGGNVLRLGLNFPIWDHGVLRAAVGEARAAASEQETQIVVLRQQAELDMATAYYTLEQSRQLVQRTGGAQLERTVRLYRLAQVSYSNGLTSYLDLLDAQQVLRNGYVSYLRALAGYETAEAALERTLGAPLPEAKSSTPARYAPPVLEAPAKAPAPPAVPPSKEMK